MTACLNPQLHHYGTSYLVTDWGIASPAVALIHSKKENELDAFQLTGQILESFRCPQLRVIFAKSLLFSSLIWISMSKIPRNLLLLCKIRLGGSWEERTYMSFSSEFMEFRSIAQSLRAQLTGPQCLLLLVYQWP